MNNELNTWGFALFSSHLHHFIPHIGWEQHLAVFQDWKNYHSRENRLIDLPRMSLSEEIDWLGFSPGILVLFHLGDHLFWPQKLAEKGIAFDLLMDRSVLDKNDFILKQLQHQCTVDGENCSYLFSDDPKLIFKIKSSLKKGRHVLLFADGTSAASVVDKRIEVDFLAGKIAVKPGVAYISHLLHCPIYTLHSQIIAQGLMLDLAQISTPESPISRENYVTQTMQAIFSSLSDLLSQEPHRWECWGYMHRNGMWNPVNGMISSKVVDCSDFLTLPMKDGWALFDRRNYRLYH